MISRHAPRPQGSRTAAGSLAQLCTLCLEHRLRGSLLSLQPNAMLWVCSDCQDKLARRVDDEGALGG